MKILMVLSLAVVFAGCVGGGKTVRIISPESQTMSDSTGYELITFDQRFETWYVMNATPSVSRAKEYYEMWNRRYVAEWNILSANPAKGNFREPIVGYEPNVDYGFELNRKLFYYFRYVEDVLKIPVLGEKGPQTMVYFPE